MSGIEKEKPDKAKLDELGIDGWSPWECEPSSFPWQYSDKETAYVFEGRVTVETEDGQKVEIEQGDLVVFPKGMKCNWTVHEKIRKVYKFG
jgi:uncharacterized cupin superfamily protein